MIATLHTLCVTNAILMAYKALVDFGIYKNGTPVVGSIVHFLLIKAHFCYYASLYATISEKYYIGQAREMPDIAPYKLARLVNSDKPISSDPNERWYIVFYVWDIRLKRLVKKRDYSVNKFTTKKARLDHAKEVIKTINKLLAEGNVVVSDQKSEEVKASQNTDIVDQNRTYSVNEAITITLTFVKSKKRESTYNAYKSAATMFLEFCKLQGWDKFSIKSINSNDIVNWLDIAQRKNANTNTTRNNNLNHLKSFLTAVKQKGFIATNPAVGIELEDEEEATRTAYSKEEIKKLKEAITANEPRLWLFISFIVYGFIRPAEIGRMQVKLVDLAKRSIYIPGSISKNKKSAHIKISEAFAGYVRQLELEKYRPDDYIFGKDLKTGSAVLPRGAAYKLHATFLTELKLKGHDLYEWKHTGVITHFLAGVDIKALQMQLRHSSLDETDRYLRSLGLFRNTEIEDKSPVI